MEFYHAEETNRLRRAIGWIVDLVVVIAMAWYFVYSFGYQVRIGGSSMSPALSSGDIVLVNRLSYDFGEPDRFDIAVFLRENAAPGVKRIIGLPGETVQIISGRIHIDGSPLSGAEGLDAVGIAGLAKDPVKLGSDEYFVLGDNRESSEDSRFAGVGNVKRKQLLGKVWLKLSPSLKPSLIAKAPEDENETARRFS